MHLKCPHCQNRINVVSERASNSFACPSCGSAFGADDVATATYSASLPKLLNQFRLLDLLGKGHFGEVWLAQDTKLDRFVAIKIPRRDDLDSDDRELFIREARAAAQLKHPNIVGVYDVNMEGDQIYIVSELIRGPNLAEWQSVHQQGPREASNLIAILADAIHFAHENGVIHRDLKPGNVLIDGEGAPHITDFGLAKRDGGEITVTMDGKIIGTPAYMSPEQARGDGHNADRRSDVYSLGIMLYEFLTGERPFCGKSKMLLIHQVLTEDPRPLRKIKRSVPRDLETICLKAIEKDPRRRYQTAAELAADLRRFGAGRPVTARPVGALEKVWRWGLRNQKVAALSFIAGLAATTAAGSLFFTRQYEPPKRTIQIKVNPAPSDVVFIPLNQNTGEPQLDKAIKKVALSSSLKLELLPGDYLIVAYQGDAETTQTFHEVYRHVPEFDEVPNMIGYRHLRRVTDASGIIELGEIQLFSTTEITSNMALIPEAPDFLMGSDEIPDTPLHYRRVPSFHIDSTEVTIGDAKRLEGWYLPERLKNSPPPDDFPLTFARHDYAVAFAERVGKRLPDEAEYEVAATRGGTQETPWGGSATDVQEWNVGPVRTSASFDVIQYNLPVWGLYSNAVEWTSTWGITFPSFAETKLPITPRDMRITRGGSIRAVTDVARLTDEGPRQALNQPDLWAKGPRGREMVVAAAAHPGLGFRCVRSTKPRLRSADFVSITGE